jgi:uncharacterized membrane-anchored protein
MRRAWLPVVLALSAMPCFAGPARGQTPAPQVKAEIDAAWAAAERTAIMGPADVKLLDQAHLKIAADEAFIPTAEANRIMAAMGNSTGPSRQGLIVSRSRDAAWLVDVVWTQEGYVRDGDAREWKADELLDSLKQGTEQDNAARLARGVPALDVVGWVEPPAYDPGAHRLVWSLSLRDRGMPSPVQTINYNTYALGREGYFSLDLITGSDTIAADKKVARDLLASLQYEPGKRYEEFNGSTDKVAAYGLGALVGVVAVKKLGLLALAGAFLVKMWKLGLLLFVGIGAAARRFFGRGGREPVAHEAGSEPYAWESQTSAAPDAPAPEAVEPQA